MGSKVSQPVPNMDDSLTSDMIEELCHDTGFTEDELRTLHTNFYKDCPDGKLTLKQFEHEYSKIMGKPTQKTTEYVRHMFRIYDQDNSQFIDFREYVMALSAASVVNRLRLVETMFSVFDLDSDGKISKDEMEKMLRTLADVTDNNRKRRRHRHDDDRKRINLQKRLDEAFNELNSNDDEYITKDEFIEWYMKSGLLSDVQTNEINVPNNTRIQQLNRKSRFMRRQRKDEQTQPVRYITRMTEQRTIPIDNDEHVDVPEKINSEDNDSCYSKENERWQHLFNSVLGQIRSQRADLPNNSNAHSPTTNHFSSWRRQGEEKLTSEYYRQKSSDIDTVRL